MTHPGDVQVPARRWLPIIIALVVFLGLPLLPTAFQSIIPIGETTVLLVAALAVCALIGWWNGGNALIAILWCALATWMMFSFGSANELGLSLRPTDTLYSQLARGWILLLVSAFGLVSIVAPAQGFLSRALVSIGIAVTGAFVLTIAVSGGIPSVHDTMQNEFSRRTERTIGWFQHVTSSPEWHEAAKLRPALDSMARDNEAELRRFPARAASALPALLALESLAALALAWALYHRLAATPIGPSLSALKEFRFSDQLIWGLAVGIAIFFLPQFAAGKSAGLNLLLFFGALYLLRGIGVLSWSARGRVVGIGLMILTALIPLVVGALALGVGVGDTWMDWRHRVKSAT
jgi:hypothetical protein